MSILKKLRRWCPQPKSPSPTNFTRLSTPILAFALIAEIVVLLVVPIAYYALLVPKPNISIMQKYPLTDSQIAASWPNLPTANQIAKSSIYLTAGPGVISSVKNCTVLNLPNYYNGRLIPVGYDIWLQYNGTWIKVPNSYLATNNPPQIPSDQQSGFIGTKLPMNYGIIASAFIIASVVAGVSYVISARRKNQVGTQLC